MARYDLSDEEWRLVEPLLRGRARESTGLMTVVWRMGYSMCSGPERLGVTCRNGMAPTRPSIIGSTVGPNEVCWAKRGIWLKVFEELAERSPQSLQLIDSSIVRAHQHAAGGKKGTRITPLAVLVAG